MQEQPGVWQNLNIKKYREQRFFHQLFFVVGLIHFPFLGTSAHLLLNGLVGLILGLATFPVVLISLLMQSLLFIEGGIISLGVNVANMAIPAVIVYYLFRSLLRKSRANSKINYLIGFFYWSNIFCYECSNRILLTFFEAS